MRTISVAVEDNGKGLPSESRERLTEPYVTTRAKGTGLGLAIVKKIMEDHGGWLVMEDREGGGARVSLAFRRRRPAARHRPPSRRAATKDSCPWRMKFSSSTTRPTSGC